MESLFLFFAGIITELPTQVKQVYLNASLDPSLIPIIIAFLVAMVLVIAGIVFINDSQRNIPVSYAKRIRGSRVYGGVSTYLPLKINQAGVIPIIFAMSILLFPQMLATFMQAAGIPWVENLARSINNLFNKAGYMEASILF